jgi:PAS domain S-box-containing protein
LSGLNDNWQRALGSSEAELRRRRFIDLVHPDDSAGTSESLQRLRAGEERVTFENRCRASDGSYRVLSWTMAVDHGVVLATGDDLTERRIAEQELYATRRTLTETRRLAGLGTSERDAASSEANERLEERVVQRTAELDALNSELDALAYSVSHDLRAPLRAIDGFTATVARRYADQLDDSGREMLERIRSAVAKMSDLITAMLQLSRLSRRQMRRERFDLSELA